MITDKWLTARENEIMKKKWVKFFPGTNFPSNLMQTTSWSTSCMLPWIWTAPTTAPTWSPTIPSSISIWNQIIPQPFWRTLHPISPIGSLGIPPMKRYLMNLSNHTKMHLMKQGTSTGWNSTQMQSRMMVNPNQVEETGVERSLGSIPHFHLMWRPMLGQASLGFWRNASPATTSCTKCATKTPSK